MDELAAASGKNVKNEPSGCQSMLRYFDSLISIPCGASIPFGRLYLSSSPSSYPAVCFQDDGSLNPIAAPRMFLDCKSQ